MYCAKEKKMKHANSFLKSSEGRYTYTSETLEKMRYKNFN